MNASAGLPSKKLEPASMWKGEALEEPTTTVMPGGLQAPKAGGPGSGTRRTVLPVEAPMTTQSAAVSEAPVQLAALWVMLHRLASRSISPVPPRVVFLAIS